MHRDITPDLGNEGPRFANFQVKYERSAPCYARVSFHKSNDVSFADIGGLDDAIDSLKQVAVMPLIHPEIFTRIGRPPIRGVLLHGEPGTGKTLLAKALSRECGCNFIPISGPELMSGIVGDSEKRIRDLF